MVEFLQHHVGDAGEIEPPRLGEAEPGEVVEFALRPGDALHLAGDEGAVEGEEAGIEAPRPALAG